MHTKKMVIVQALVIALAFVALGYWMTACTSGYSNKVTGGGWVTASVCKDVAVVALNSQDCPTDSDCDSGCKDKATFGFNLKCEPGDPDTVKGQFQYTDHGGFINANGSFRKVSFHGRFIDLPPGFECNRTVYEGIFEGTYTPQPPKLGDEGTFRVEVFDGGEPGPSTGDAFYILLTGGVFDGYENGGCLCGGNIQAHVDQNGS